MNDADLRQLLRDADGRSSPMPPQAVSTRSVRDRQRQHAARRRRRVAASVAAVLIATGLAATVFIEQKPGPVGATPASFGTVKGDAGVAPTQQASSALASGIDARLAESEQRIAVLERVERMARLQARRAAVRDPVAELNERRADALLANADGLRRAPDGHAARQRMLAIVVRLYPQTVSAAVARQELDHIEPENGT